MVKVSLVCFHEYWMLSFVIPLFQVAIKNSMLLNRCHHILVSYDAKSMLIPEDQLRSLMEYTSGAIYDN